MSFDPDFLLVLNKWQCKDKILETRRLIILVVILLTMRVPSLWLYVFFSTHKMCWWLVISVSQFLQDLSKYRDALHGRKVFFMIQVSSPAFTLTQFNSWSVLISFCSFFLYHNFRLSNIVLLLKRKTFCVCDTGYKFQDIQLFIIVQCFFFRHNQCG